LKRPNGRRYLLSLNLFYTLFDMTSPREESLRFFVVQMN